MSWFRSDHDIHFISGLGEAYFDAIPNSQIECGIGTFYHVLKGRLQYPHVSTCTQALQYMKLQSGTLHRIIAQSGTVPYITFKSLALLYTLRCIPVHIALQRTPSQM